MCGFDGCEKRHYAKGLCQGHYAQRHRDGKELRPLIKYGWNDKVAYRQHRRARQHGLTVEIVSKTLEAQRNCCKLCDKPLNNDYRIDHDHSCCPGQSACGGCFRGILCNGCNVGLGLLGDTPESLMRAVAYLFETQNVLNSKEYYT